MVPPSTDESGRRTQHKFSCLDEDGIVKQGEILSKGQMYHTENHSKVKAL